MPPLGSESERIGEGREEEWKRVRDRIVRGAERREEREGKKKEDTFFGY